MKNISVAVVSTTSRPADISGNLRQITEAAEHASASGVELLLSPELSASGYGFGPDVLATAEVAGQGRIYDQIAAAAGRTAVAICAGFIEKEGRKCFLSQYLVFPDGRVIVQRKIRVAPAEQPLASTFVNGWAEDFLQTDREPFQIFEIKGIRCAIVICADYGIPLLFPFLRQRGVQLVLGPSAGGGTRNERVTTEQLRSSEGREKYLSVQETVFFPRSQISDCLEWGIAFAGANLIGFDGKEFCHAGHAMIINPMGEVVALCPGIPNLDRQRMSMAHAVIDVDEGIF